MLYDVDVDKVSAKVEERLSKADAAKKIMVQILQYNWSFCNLYFDSCDGFKVIAHADEGTDSSRVHSIAKALEVKFDKSKNSDGFTYRGFYNGIEIILGKILPPTCRIVEEEVPIDESEMERIQEALEKGTKLVRKVVCNGNIEKD